MTQMHQFEIAPDDPVFDIENTDLSVSPAEDIYQFANGGWLDANPVPDEYGAWGTFHEINARNEDILHEILERAAAGGASAGSLDHMVGAFYTSGMDTDRIEELGVEPIQPLLDLVSGMVSRDELASVIATLHRNGVGGFFSSGVQPDFEDATANLLYVGQAGLGLPDRDYYLREDETSQELLEKYVRFVEKIFELLGVASPEKAAAAVVDIETALARISYTNVQMRDIELIANKWSLTEAGDAMPKFGLRRYLEDIGAATESAIGVDNIDFFPAVDELIADRSVDDLATYLTWNVLRATAASLPERFDSANFDFYGRALGGQKAQKVRWKRVLAAATSDIGHAVARLYVAESFPPAAKARMEHLVDTLLVAMRRDIESLEWMSDATKEQALEKLDAFGYKIGYPDVWREYDGLAFDPGTWLANRLASSRFEFDRQIGLLGRPVDPHDWSMPAHVVNAYYHPLRNEIAFPAGILQPPFFWLEGDDAANYGAIGAVIGHEITHGFDDQGSRFDADGNVRDWWTQHDRDEFMERAGVLVEQFNEYEVEPGLHVNGELTLGENIADVGGLKIALAALDAELGNDTDTIFGMTPHQRFYLAWATQWRQNYTDEYLRFLVNADPHSPSHFRCDGPLSNLATFAAAFDIPDDSPTMRPVDKRVDIW